jgi:hypothetical protein
VNTLQLTKEYSAGTPGLIFRLRLQSANQALGHRLQHGRGPRVTAIAPERPLLLPRIERV